MKIQGIRIGGFRGIPPMKCGDPSLQLPLGTGVLAMNLLLYGDNAFGKSSIADALEWFFKERIRAHDFVGEYSNADTVHVNVGRPGYPDRAFIELDLLHNGQIHTVRKELDRSGNKCHEEMGSVGHIVNQVGDEVVVLDHDKFRTFVTAANKDRWQTFSSLIGYELLDHFRAGITSLTGSSLTSHLGLTTEERAIKEARAAWARAASQVITRCAILETDDPLQALHSHFTRRLVITLASLGLAAPENEAETDERYWAALHERAEPSPAYRNASERLSNLSRTLDSLEPLSTTFALDIETIERLARRLASKKEQFDRRVLSDFYRLGIDVITSGSTTRDQCPLCDKPVDWQVLQRGVESKLSALDFDTIQTMHRELVSCWRTIDEILTSRGGQLRNHEFGELRDTFSRIPDSRSMQSTIDLQSFEPDTIARWAEECRNLEQAMERWRSYVEQEKRRIEASITRDPMIEAASQIAELYQLWHEWTALRDQLSDIEKRGNRLQGAVSAAEQLREIARSFREELSDFSGRVAGLINDDVHNYYSVLHPDDKIRPFLEASISGNQRIVRLRCDYHECLGRDAPSLLSESHRNSLGLAVLLAFMHYKRGAGSPVEFCVLDDVTQSFDNNHRTQLLSLLEDGHFPEISQQQIILLTHDRTFADLVKRGGEQEPRPDWIRLDIRNWWLQGMMLEPCTDPIQKAHEYLGKGDEIAAAIYARRALEQTYKKVLENCSVRMRYQAKPWLANLDDYRKAIMIEVEQLWHHGEGFIDPINDLTIRGPMTSQRILNFTVHDSDFLDNPISLGDVRAALKIIEYLSNRFRCKSCGRWYHTLQKHKGHHPQCSRADCNAMLT